jgi:hypothetical protein
MPGSVRFGELFVFPHPAGGGTQMIISVVGTHPKCRFLLKFLKKNDIIGKLEYSMAFPPGGTER